MEVETGRKFDLDKIRTDLLPSRALEEVAAILTHGSKKYGDRNWETGIKYGRLYGALLRHLWAWWRGESVDEETGKSHLAHAACCILMLLHYTLHLSHYAPWDDRPTYKPAYGAD